jgi:hypothetical protein
MSSEAMADHRNRTRICDFAQSQALLKKCDFTIQPENILQGNGVWKKYSLRISIGLSVRFEDEGFTRSLRGLFGL